SPSATSGTAASWSCGMASAGAASFSTRPLATSGLCRCATSAQERRSAEGRGRLTAGRIALFAQAARVVPQGGGVAHQSCGRELLRSGEELRLRGIEGTHLAGGQAVRHDPVLVG